MANDQDALSALLRQEEALQFDAFSNEMALEIGMRLVEEARRAGQAITVDIRRHGQQLFHCALAGTSVDNDRWIERKWRVVDRFGHSSYYMGRYYASRDTTIEAAALLDPREYAAHGGAFPVIVKGVGPVGNVTVSGLPQEEDHRLVVRVLADYLGVDVEA